jgi:glycosyltransferase involved in cell wall biosynthesis
LASLPLASEAAYRLTRLPKSDIVHVHLSERGSFVREGSLVILSHRLGRATVVTLHGADFLPFARRRPRLAANVLRHAHVITCLDREVLDLVRRLAPKARVALMPNPVPIDRGSYDASKTEEVVLFAGEIGLRKGVDVLCRAWPLVAEARPSARCVAVGPVNDFIVPDIERFEIRPPVGARDMGNLIRAARVIALPSRAEAMPMILTEAMSAGRPFVSTPIGGIPELERGGLLVPVGDHAELADRLIDVLADPHLAQTLGEWGLRVCSETRGPDVVGNQLHQLYRAAAGI